MGGGFYLPPPTGPSPLKSSSCIAQKWLLKNAGPENTHCIASLYQNFKPQHALELANRLEIHYTPKHGSWLDMAEIELSALGRQCIGKNRIPDLDTLRTLLRPWYTDRNKKQRGIDWRFTTDEVRIKLKRLYPIINI